METKKTVSNRGFFKQSREKMDHWLFSDPARWGAWNMLLLRARFAPGKELKHNSVVEVPRGSFVDTTSGLTSYLKWSRARVRRFLQTLRDNNELVISKITGRAYLFTIVFYDEWQGIISEEIEIPSGELEVTKPATLPATSEGVIGRLRLTSTGTYYLNRPLDEPVPGHFAATLSSGIAVNKQISEALRRKESKNIKDMPKKASKVSEVKPKGKPKKPGYTEAFEAFWNVCPRKVGKKKAFESWSKIDPDPNLRLTIIRAMENQTQALGWDQKAGTKDEQFIPHPATWLNQERWNDEVKVKSKEPVTGHYKVL